MSNIGFVGLGLMGSAMVNRLQDKGHTLAVLGNRSRPNIDAAVARGATEVKSARELASQAEIVMLCVGTSDQVEGLIEGDDGVIAGLKPGSVVVDFGTSLPASTRKLGAAIEAAGGQLLDAPLGRTPAHAVDGLLNIMCAGNQDAFSSVEPVLKDLGENVFHLGDLGSGHTIKLINNFFGMTIANAMSEAFAMADLQGVDRKALYDVMAAGPLHCGMMDFVKGYGVDGDPSQLAFAIKNAAKDVGYYSAMAKDSGASSIMSQSTLQALTEANEAGQGENMVSQMVDFYQQKLTS